MSNEVKEVWDFESLLDHQHTSFDLFNDPFVIEAWTKRYKAEGESHIFETFKRVANYVGKNESQEIQHAFYEAMRWGLFLPGGRNLSSAGLDTSCTLHNCYVSRTVEDSMPGINLAFSEAMDTLARFGGIGTDFSTLRPKGAKIGSQGLISPGVTNWINMWNFGADRVQQSGHRRGAMMGTLRCDHPDIFDFIECKNIPGVFTNFNISVLITNGFMEAIKADADWNLWHEIPPANTPNPKKMAFFQKEVYVYQTVKARDLWFRILKNTFDHTEPGVIFIDRINALNNLSYCETISCTNPCGEQPLPPWGACDLGHIGLSRMVSNPFKPSANINRALIDKVVRLAVRFLDDVIDVSNFPVYEQGQEQKDKRRIGLGYTGLHDFLMQLGVRYGSPESVKLTEMVTQFIAEIAYDESIQLAIERGAFHNFDKVKHLAQPFVDKLRISTREGIAGHGIRNGVILTIAPTGTVSCAFGNVSTGIEPIFGFKQNRKIWIDGAQQETHANTSFIQRFYDHCFGTTTALSNKGIDAYTWAVTMKDVSVKEQIDIQAAAQKWIDASISKTVNTPADITFEDFQKVYIYAYEQGCKGCTTYKDGVRGSVVDSADEDIVGLQVEMKVHTDKPIEGPLPPGEYTTTIERVIPLTRPMTITLSDEDVEGIKNFTRETAEKMLQEVVKEKVKRPPILAGCTYRIKWPHLQDNIFLTINEYEGRPWEVFIMTRDLRQIEWMVLSMMQISRALQRGADPIEEAELLISVQGAHEGAHIGQKYYSSLLSHIGEILKAHFQKYDLEEEAKDYHSDPFNVSGVTSGRWSSDDTHQAQPPTSEFSPFAWVDLSASKSAEEVKRDAKMQLHGQAGKRCPKCRNKLIMAEGCEQCSACDYNKCG